MPRICWYQGFHSTRALSDTLGAQPEEQHFYSPNHESICNVSRPGITWSSDPSWMNSTEKRLSNSCSNYCWSIHPEKQLSLPPFSTFSLKKKKRSGVISSSKSHGSLQSGYLQDYSKHTYIDVYIYICNDIDNMYIYIYIYIYIYFFSSSTHQSHCPLNPGLEWNNAHLTIFPLECWGKVFALGWPGVIFGEGMKADFQPCGTTVDGWNLAPVEVGSLSYYL